MGKNMTKKVETIQEDQDKLQADLTNIENNQDKLQADVTTLQSDMKNTVSFNDSVVVESEPREGGGGGEHYLSDQNGQGKFVKEAKSYEEMTIKKFSENSSSVESEASN